MRRTLRVLFVRHGESEDNAGLPSESMASTPLTPAGLRQAEAVAASLETAPGRFIVSPYVRAQQTSRPARAKFPGAPLEEWPVQEFTFLPASAYHGTTLAERQPAEDAYWQANDPRVVLGDGAESFDAFFARVADARARLEALECDSVIVFSHKKVVTALLWCWLSGLPSSGAARMSHFRNFDRAVELPNCACVEVRLEDGRAWLGPVRTLQPAVPAG
jgi:broad specificity phosphatase PhoE